MDAVLLVSSAAKSSETLSLWVKAMGYRAAVAQSGGAARRLLMQNVYKTVVIHCPLSDEFGQELAVEIADTKPTGVIMILKNELLEKLSAQVEPYGVYLLPLTLNRQLLGQALRLSVATTARLEGMYRENTHLQKKVEEIRLVSRAKSLLMENEAYSEPEAHRFIEKNAMDTRRTRLEIAQDILEKYERV